MPKGEEMGGDVEINTGVLHDRYSAPNSIQMLVGKLEGKNHWGDQGVDRWIILGWI